MRQVVGLLLVALFSGAVAGANTGGSGGPLSLPSYHYGAPISVECMNRSS